MTNSHLLAFVGIVAALSITPGATTMLITRSVIARGQHAGFRVILGGTVGVYVHATLSALGLSLILVQSEQAFQAVKLLGAAYLCYLGAQSIRRGWRAPSSAVSVEPVPLAGGRWAGEGSFTEGLVTLLLSPEASLFYLTILPQFIDPGEPVLVKSFYLATIHVGVRGLWYALFTLFLGRIVRILQQPRVRQGLEILSGVALIGLALRVITAAR